MDADPGIVSVVVGTAGHIDHGKSSLVRRLTGVDPDRLKEEKEKEITIDLGFAPLRLPDGRTVGMIDVPGHERFVKNMVAGATGIDLVILVVAADDGVMPQTREHLEILGLLGIEHGLVALTKVDVVDPELVEVCELELEDLLQGTFLAGAPVCRVSSVTGEGLEALQARIAEAVGRVPPRPASGAFRLPIQRVFSAPGFGTVLTGVPLEGSAGLGDTLEVLTGRGPPRRGRVRGLQAYGRQVERVRAGHSSAVNLTDTDRKSVQRGDTVATPGVFTPGTLWEARLTFLSSQHRPLENRETVRFHVGTSEVLGELVLLDQPRLDPGATALVQVRLREPVVAAGEDRFVIRRHSPMETLGGGVILGASKWRLKPFKGFVLRQLSEKEQALGDSRSVLLLELERDPRPRRAEELVGTLNRPRADVDADLAALAAEGRVVEASAGKGQPAWVSAGTFDEARELVRQSLAAWHREHPARDACPRQELRTRAGALHDGLLATALERLIADGEVVAAGPGWALSGHAATLAGPAETFAAELVALFQERAYQTPTWPQALELLRPDLDPVSAEDVFQHLVERGQLVLVGEDLVFHRDRIEAAKELVRERITREGPLAAGAFKDLIDSSRRYTIPLLEHLDEIGFTRREGDVRVLR